VLHNAEIYLCLQDYHSTSPEVWSFQIHRSTCDEIMDEFVRWLAASILELVLLRVTLCQQGLRRCSFYQPYWGLLCFVLYNCGRASSLYRAQPSTIEHFDINWVYFIQGSEQHVYISVLCFQNSHLLLSRSRLRRRKKSGCFGRGRHLVVYLTEHVELSQEYVAPL
jgi:hypothetical protein